MASSLTDLEYALLCLIASKPRAGYDLLKTLGEWPFPGQGRSPGAIYPALQRMAERGLILGKEEGAAKRPRTTYRLSAQGKRTLKTWMRASLVREDLLHRPDTLMLKFSFMPRLAGLDATLAFLDEYRQLAGALGKELACYQSAAAGDISPHSRLAIELSQALLATRAEWAIRARMDLAADPPK